MKGTDQTPPAGDTPPTSAAALPAAQTPPPGGDIISIPPGSADTAPPSSTPVPVVVAAVHRPWLGVAISCGVTALVLVILLIPGVLRFPEASLTDERLVALQEETNRALEDRIRELRGMTDRAVCTRDGRLYEPDEDGMALNALPDAPPPPPPQPADLTTPSDSLSPGAEAETLVTLMDKTTALVVAPAADGSGIGVGSGFFVGPGLLLTNHHVIEEAGADIYVFNKPTGRPLRASLRAASDGSSPGQPDFALLDLPDARDLPYLALAEETERMTQVIAAGYPSLVIDTDSRFRALMEGDAAGLPEVSFTEGIVTARQDAGPVSLVLHSAATSPGNSGGPLIDLCGRVVGINTFVRAEETLRRMNYALAATSIRAFLTAQGVQPRVLATPCRPVTAAAAAAAAGTTGAVDEETGREGSSGPTPDPVAPPDRAGDAPAPTVE